MHSRPYQTGFSPSSSSSSPVPPSSSSSNTRNSKLDHIIQNFYTKTAQLIIQSRITSDNIQNRDRRGESRKLNKWFNIATEDIEILKDELKYWRTLAIQSTEVEPPPMIIDIYLDTSKLAQNQALMVTDETLRRNRVDLGTSQTNAAYGVQRILIETWTLTLNHPLPDFPVDLPNIYKRSIVFFRSLHSLVRLLPAYNLHRKLQKFNDSHELSIGYQFTPRNVRRHDEISLETPILNSDARNPTKSYSFTDIMTPLGTFKLQVNYRRNCDFKVEDSECDISARFVDMDEHYFTPTITKYQQEYNIKNRPASMYDTRSVTGKAEQVVIPTSSTSSGSSKTSYSSSSNPREIVQRQRYSITSTSRHSPVPSSPLHRDSKDYNLEPIISTLNTSVSRRTSVPAFSPFKSPSLSSSPQAENLMSGFKNNTSVDKTKPSSSTESGSGSFGRKIEFSSSFDKYKSSPSRVDMGGTSMTRRLSRNSDQSSINILSEMGDTDLEEFVKFIGAKQDLKLFQPKLTPTPSTSSQLGDSTQQQQTGTSPISESNSSIGTSGGYGTGSVYKSKKALSHFQNLRETHNNLSESLTTSMIAMGLNIGGSSSSNDQNEPMITMTGVSPGSSSSSTSRSYQPIIPSPLHAEQNSSSPVRIPRSLPQQFTPIVASSSSHNAHSISPGNSSGGGNNSQGNLSRHRRSLISQQKQPLQQQSPSITPESPTTQPSSSLHKHFQSSPHQQQIAYSSYPQDRRHTDLNRYHMMNDDDNDDVMDTYNNLRSRRMQSTGNALSPLTSKKLNSKYNEGENDNDNDGDDDNDDDDNKNVNNNHRKNRKKNDKNDNHHHSSDNNNNNNNSTNNINNNNNNKHNNLSRIEEKLARHKLTSDNFNNTTNPRLNTSQRTISSEGNINEHSSTSTTITASVGGGGARTSIVDDDDSLVFKMSELGGDPSSDSMNPITSPILFNRPPPVVGPSHTVLTTKRLESTNTPSSISLRRTSSSDNIRQHAIEKDQEEHIHQDGKDSPGASSCKSEPTATNCDMKKQHPYFGGW
ncbi:autophagy-related protein 13-domain-containing protein [Cunninghamella echinulata]|nr:autophagy-related protein 13-domain-containing protein [Cunninghamella echinulata]